MQWLTYLDRHHRLAWAAAQQSGVRARYGLSVEDTETAAWAIDASGRRYRGAAAIVAALATATGLHAIQALSEFSLVGRVGHIAYGWIANHRRLFPGATPYCSNHLCED